MIPDSSKEWRKKEKSAQNKNTSTYIAIIVAENSNKTQRD